MGPDRLMRRLRPGLRHATPRLTPEGYRNFYTSDAYRLLYDGENYRSTLEACYTPERARHIYALAAPQMRRRGLRTVLEIGCGGGWNLLPFLEAGHPAVGYDLSPALTDLGRSKGLDVRQGDIEDVTGRFDCIVVNHVIEHFPDFFGKMRALKELLAPGGILYVGVPNMDNFWSSQFQNVHLYYFTPRTLAYFLSRLGLRPLVQGAASSHMHGIWEPAAETPQDAGPRGEFLRMLFKYGRYRVFRQMRKLLGR